MFLSHAQPIINYLNPPPPSNHFKCSTATVGYPCLHLAGFPGLAGPCWWFASRANLRLKVQQNYVGNQYETLVRDENFDVDLQNTGLRTVDFGIKIGSSGRK